MDTIKEIKLHAGSRMVVRTMPFHKSAPHDTFSVATHRLTPHADSNAAAGVL